MRESIRQFVKIVSETIPIREPIYEFGALQVPGQVGWADLRPFFPDREYVGCDMQEGPGVDRILDLHDIDLPSESVGTVLALDTLEHVEYPHRALEEIYRVLRPGGVAVISSVMDFPIHDYPFDYWRFTPKAFESLLRAFEHSFVGSAGRPDFPHTVVGIGFKSKSGPPEDFFGRFDEWKREWYRPEKLTWKLAVGRMTPPAVRAFYRRARRLLR